VKLSREDYSRGLLSWQGESKGAVVIDFTDPHGNQRQTGRLTDPDGSILHEMVGDSLAVAFRPETEGQTRLPYPFRLERIDSDGTVRTRIWDIDEQDEKHVTLMHVPGYGYFYRIVVVNTLLAWNQDTVFRCGDVLVRFESAAVVGEYTPPLRTIEAVPEGFRIIGEPMGTKTFEGIPCIDIVAPGTTPDEAERRAHGVYGLIILLFGDQAVGTPLMTHALTAVRGQPQSNVAHTEITAKPGMALNDLAFDMLDRFLTVLVTTTEPKYVELALH
jgi:hypothetical protein